MTSAVRASIAIAVAFGAVASAAGAQAAAPRDRAKTIFQDGERDFQLGKFDAAIEAYERAFNLDPQPAFIFNIALAHRRQYEIDGKLEHLLRARELYRNYLRLEPQATNRAGVEKLINDLTTKIDAARGRPEAETAPASPEPASTSTITTRPGPLPGAASPPSPTRPAAVLASPAEPVAPPSSSIRRWVIGGTVAAAAVVAALAVFFITRSGPSFDGPGVNVTDMR